MSSISSKEELCDDSAFAVENEAKMRKEDEQVLPSANRFYFVDDVTLELRSIEGYMGQEKGDAFRQILEMMEKSDTLVRRNQEQDVAPLPEQRFIYMEDITDLRNLFDEYCGKAGRAKFEEQLKKMVSDDRLVRNQTNHNMNSNIVLENVDIPQQLEPFHQEMQTSQAMEKSTEAVEEEVRVVESKPDMQNLRADDNCFLTAAAATEEPPKFSNQTKMVAQIINAELLKKLREHGKLKGNEAAVEELCDIIKQRETLIENAQSFDESSTRIDYRLLESILGAPPTDQIRKIRLHEMTLDSSEMFDLLRWFRPIKVIISCDPEALVDDPSLISGVDVIEFREVNVDEFMNHFKAELIHVEGTATWTVDSILRLVAEHMVQCTTHQVHPDNGSRKISCCCQDRTEIEGWKMLYAGWSKLSDQLGHVEPPVTLDDNGIDLVTLTLH